MKRVSTANLLLHFYHNRNRSPCRHNGSVSAHLSFIGWVLSTIWPYINTDYLLWLYYCVIPVWTCYRWWKGSNTLLSWSSHPSNLLLLGVCVCNVVYHLTRAETDKQPLGLLWMMPSIEFIGIAYLISYSRDRWLKSTIAALESYVEFQEKLNLKAIEIAEIMTKTSAVTISNMQAAYGPSNQIPPATEPPEQGNAKAGKGNAET